MPDLWKEIHERLHRGETLASAVIANEDGSTPRSAGSKMLVGPQGIVNGTIGGGSGEAMVVGEAAKTLADGECRLVALDMTGSMATGADLICGGRLDVFVCRLEPDHATLFEVLRRRVARGQESLLAYPARGRARPSLLFPGGGGAGEELAPELAAAIWEDRPSAAGLVEFGGQAYFVERVRPPVNLILAGGGHVSQALARMAALVDFRVAVLDDRPEFAAPARFPWLAPERLLVVPDFAGCLERSVIGVAADRRCFVAILTRGHAHDYRVLSQALRTEAGYIGMIGSRRKREQTYERLLREGFAQADIDRVHSPIGLAIKAETPAEIAVSIVAELIAARAGMEGE